MRVHIVLDLDAVDAYICDNGLPQKAMLVAELMQSVADNDGIVVIPGTVFQTLAARGKEERDRLLHLVTDPDSIVVVPPTQVTETLEIAELAERHGIDPGLAHALIIARDNDAGLATFGPDKASATGVIRPENVFQI
ncbi:MAG TPA: hypothetical protein DGG94_21590 [Micromonosporaceae bacterium]|nr:hypothetical protein [Micromonosporaceae bacterium]HCU52354.1 hypothetical protein [Micromonosporaceae bacterium]